MSMCAIFFEQSGSGFVSTFKAMVTIIFCCIVCQRRGRARAFDFLPQYQHKCDRGTELKNLPTCRVTVDEELYSDRRRNLFLMGAATT